MKVYSNNKRCLSKTEKSIKGSVIALKNKKEC